MTNRGFQHTWWLTLGAIVLVLVLSALTAYFPLDFLGEFAGLLIGEFFLIIPCIVGTILIAKYYKEERTLNECLGIHKFKPILIPILFLLPLSAQYFSTYISLPVALGSKVLFGNVDNSEVIPSTALGMVQILITLCVFAPVLEEWLCRGILMRMLEKYGVAVEILVSGLVFAMLHISAQSIIGLFFIGALFGAVKKITRSIFPCIIMHSVNNGVVFLMSCYAMDDISTIGGVQGVLTVLASLFLLGVGCAFPLLFWAFLRLYKNIDKSGFIYKSQSKIGVSVGMILSIAVCVGFNILVIILRIRSGELMVDLSSITSSFNSFILP